MCIVMYSKCLSCRLYDSLICGRFCKGSYSHFDSINRRLYYYVNPQKQVCGPVEAHLLPFYGVNQESYVWAKGMRDWTQVSRVPELHFIPSVSVTRIQESVNIHTRENTVPAILGNIPLGTKIVYALYLLVLLILCGFHLFLVPMIVDSGLDIISLIILSLFLILSVIGNVISIWGLWQLFIYQRKAGFWYAVLSFSVYLIFFSAMAGWFSFDYEGTFAHPTANDVFRDFIYPIIGASLGLVLSYVFIGVLWFCLYFKRKGIAFISRLNNEKLIFSLSLLRLFPILFDMIFIVLWTIGSVFF